MKRVGTFKKQPKIDISIPDTKVIRAITEGARNLNVVTIVYTSASGVVTVRNTEPYEIKDGKYWGFCVDPDSYGIRQFNIGNIHDAVVTKEKFRPRWPVKIH